MSEIRVFYAGIGARKTPREILGLMQVAAQALADLGWVLRSGHAPGADRAFEDGAGRHAQIFLPWPTFDRSEPLYADEIFDRPTHAARLLSAGYHPAWQRLKRGAQDLHARNAHQILGHDLQTPARFVLCWTPDAKFVGGTGQAMRMALDRNIPIYNLANPNHRWRVERMVESVDLLDEN